MRKMRGWGRGRGRGLTRDVTGVRETWGGGGGGDFSTSTARTMRMSL